MREYQVEYKGYYVKPNPQVPSAYVVVTTGQGGKIPQVLEGLFTSRVVANEAIDLYLATKTVEAKNNDKAIKTGGSK